MTIPDWMDKHDTLTWLLIMAIVINIALKNLRLWIMEEKE
jgi:hypothetical protein